MILDMSPIVSGKQHEIYFDYLLDINSYSERDDAVLPPYGIKFPESVSVSGKVTDYAGYIALNAVAKIKYIAECSRCLAPVEGEFSLQFDRTVAQSGVLSDEDSDDYVIMNDGKLDIDAQLMEELMLEFPNDFLCDENCKGLCVKCGKPIGKDKSEGGCECPPESEKKEIDPRFAILQKLLDK